MPAKGECSVCLHPDVAIINAAIRAGTPSLRDIAEQHPPLKHGAIFRHTKTCGVPKGPAQVVLQNKKAAVAPQQVERASQAITDSLVSRLQERREHIAEAHKLSRELAFLSSGKGPDGSGDARPEDVELAIKGTKLLVDAVIAALKVDETAGRASGELQTGSQLNVQLNVALGERAPAVGKVLGQQLFGFALPEIERRLAGRPAIALVEVMTTVGAVFEELAAGIADPIEKALKGEATT